MFTKSSKSLICLSLVASLTAFSFSGCNDPNINVNSSKSSEVDMTIDAFANACNMGPWTQAALTRSRGLTTIFEALKDKSECKGIEKSMEAASQLENGYGKLLQNGDMAKQALLKESLNNLTITLQSPNLDEAQKKDLVEQYSNARVQLTQLQQQIKVGGGQAVSEENVANSINNMRSYMNTLISESDNLTNCYANNPSAALQIAGSVTEMAGSFVPNTAGLVLAGVAKLVQVGVQYARTLPISRAIYDLKRSRMPVALQCGMEVLTRDYCKARDARTLTDLDRYKDQKPVPFFNGADLIENSMPVLNEWLFDVTNGVKPVNVAQAEILDAQFKKLNVATSMRRLAEGAIPEAKWNISRTNDADIKRAYIRELVLDLAAILINKSINIFVGETQETLITKILNAPFLNSMESVDIYLNRVVTDSVTVSFIENNLFDPTTGLYSKAYREVVRVFNEKVNIDTPKLVRSATARRANGVSPLGAMKRLMDFLDNYAYDSRKEFAEQESIMIQNFRSQLITVIGEISKPTATQEFTEGMDEKATTAESVIALVYSTFKLENSNVYLPGRVSRFVTDDLTNRVCRGEGPSTVEDILILAGRDMMSQLAQNGLTPYQVNTDIDNGQALTTSTLNQFRDFFAQSIAWAIQDKLAMAEQNLEPKDGSAPAPNRNVVAQLCLMTLISGTEWPSQVDINWCRGSKIQSKEAQLTISFDDLEKRLKEKSFNDRACLYEDFLRVDQLAFALRANSNPVSGDLCEAGEKAKSETFTLPTTLKLDHAPLSQSTPMSRQQKWQAIVNSL